MSISGNQERIDLVGKQPKTQQREITSEFKNSNNYSTRYIKKRLGSLLPGSEDWEGMAKAENKGTNKRNGAESSKVCIMPTNQNNSFANGKDSSTSLHC